MDYMMNGFILQENTSILISRNGKTLYSILQESGLDLILAILLFCLLSNLQSFTIRKLKSEIRICIINV